MLLGYGNGDESGDNDDDDEDDGGVGDDMDGEDDVGEDVEEDDDDDDDGVGKDDGPTMPCFNNVSLKKISQSCGAGGEVQGADAGLSKAARLELDTPSPAVIEQENFS